MIELRNNPVEGSSLKLGLSFKDPLGKYYIPVYVNYTFLALNNDEESWSVVDNLYEVSLAPQSTISLVIPNVKTITETTLRRKVVIKYQAFIDNQYCDFVDEVNFTIQPKPYIVGPEPVPPEPEIYIRVLSCDLIVGSLTAAPILPVFKLKTNMPSVEEGVIAVVTDESGEEISCDITPDMTDTVFTIATNKALERSSNYKLTVTGLKSKVGDYPLENPFVLNFITAAGDPKIQDEKEVTIVANGTEEVLPDGESEGIAKVIVHTEIPLEQNVTREYEHNGVYNITPSDGFTAITNAEVIVNVPLEASKSVTISENGISAVVPTDGFDGLQEVVIETAIPLETDKSETITENGTVTILPTDGFTAMTKLEVVTAIPLEEEVSATVSTDGDVTLTPSDGYTAMKTAVVHVNTGGTKALFAYDGDNNLTFYLTKVIGSTGDYTVLPDPAESAYEGFDTYHIIKVGAEIQITYKGADVMLTRNASKDIMR